MYEEIILVLRHGWGDPQFKYWVQKHFMLIKVGNLDVVYSRDKINRPVVIYEEVYTKLSECHNRVGHHGRDKTWHEVKTRYSWIPYDVVMIFIKLCDSCSNRQIFPKFPASKPIISIGYLTRIQMDLIDMRCRPDGNFKWILHVKDHFTKFSWSYPLESKEAEPVAEKLLNQFYAYGPPCILQSDNGKEFVARVIKDLRKTWTDLIILNGRARHPQTQGLIERGNRTLEVALGKWMQHNKTDEWSKGLSPVIYSINTSIAETTNKTPYELVFGQQPRSDFEMWKIISESGVEDEENLPDNLKDLGFLAQLYDTHNIEEGGSNNLTTEVTPQSQSSAVIPANNLDTAFSTINIKDSRYLSKCNNNDTHVQDISTMNNDENIQSISCDTPNHRHKRIHDEAEADYLKSVAKRQRLYDNAVKQQQYQLGDLVGLQIDRVDPTNTTPKILPCKVMSIHSSSNDCIMYKLCTMKGVLSVLYGVQDLLDLRKCDFADLRSVDPTNLPIMAFTQACKEYVSAGINPVIEACNCNGKCATKSCPCKAKDGRCCTKCHPKKKCPCANV